MGAQPTDLDRPPAGAGLSGWWAQRSAGDRGVLIATAVIALVIVVAALSSSHRMSTSTTSSSAPATTSTNPYTQLPADRQARLAQFISELESAEVFAGMGIPDRVVQSRPEVIAELAEGWVRTSCAYSHYDGDPSAIRAFTNDGNDARYAAYVVFAAQRYFCYYPG